MTATAYTSIAHSTITPATMLRTLLDSDGPFTRRVHPLGDGTYLDLCLDTGAGGALIKLRQLDGREPVDALRRDTFVLDSDQVTALVQRDLPACEALDALRCLAPSLADLGRRAEEAEEGGNAARETDQEADESLQTEEEADFFANLEKQQRLEKLLTSGCENLKDFPAEKLVDFFEIQGVAVSQQAYMCSLGGIRLVESNKWVLRNGEPVKIITTIWGEDIKYQEKITNHQVFKMSKLGIGLNLSLFGGGSSSAPDKDEDKDKDKDKDKEQEKENEEKSPTDGEGTAAGATRASQRGASNEPAMRRVKEGDPVFAFGKPLLGEPDAKARAPIPLQLTFNLEKLDQYHKVFQQFEARYRSIYTPAIFEVIDLV